MRLTDEWVKRQKRPTRGQLLKWDDLLAGFGVRFTPSRPDTAVFVVQWREPDGRKPRESLRPHWPSLSVAKAREQARKRLGEVVAIKGSAGARKLRDAMRDWFEAQTERQAWRPRYRIKVDALIRHYIEGEPSPRVRVSPSTRQAIQELADKPVGSVGRSDVLRVADGIKRGAADQLLAIISAFYNWSFDRGVEITNPARNRLRITPRHVRSRILSDAEFLQLWRAIEIEGDPAFGAFAALAFTGARRREVTQMRWSEIDLEASTWSLPADRRKTGRRDPETFVIDLHSAVLAMLKRQPRLEGNPFVFWGRRDKRAFEFHHALMQRLRALEIPDWRLHDVRRYMRSGLARLGVQQAVAEMCLGHIAKGGLVAVYDRHTYAEEKREAWQRWGDHLVQLTALRP